MGGSKAPGGARYVDSFDSIYCSHVLEHVPRDRQAMREFRRILRPSGWAVLNVPIAGAATVEDPAVTDPQERLRLFGQVDHVRRYGHDFGDRLREAGFTVTEYKARTLLNENALLRLGIPESESLFYCSASALG